MPQTYRKLSHTCLSGGACGWYYSFTDSGTRDSPTRPNSFHPIPECFLINHFATVTAASALGLAPALASADVIFSDSFKYGNTTDDIDTVSNYDDGSSGVMKYDHDGGLTHPGLTNEAGGALHQDFNDGGSRSANEDAYSLDFSTYAAGTEFWFAGLIQYNVDGNEAQSIIFEGGTVTEVGFGIDADGDVFLRGSDNGGAISDIDTGVDASIGETYLFLLKATQGTGSSPTNSQLEFWFDPNDTSSEAALGTPVFDTGTDSKFGRHAQDHDSVTLFAGPIGRIDEVRVATSLSEAVNVPEPASLALLGLGGLMLLPRRR